MIVGLAVVQAATWCGRVLEREPTPKTTLTETIILSAASARRSGHVLPLPSAADVKSPKVIKLLKNMLANGLLEERPTSVAKSSWRADPDGRQYLLRLSELGRATVGGDSPAGQAPSDVAEPVAATESDRPLPPAGKLGRVLLAVQNDSGASIADLTALTGWQPHTIRASLTRLRQTGVPIQLIGDDGQKRYVAARAAGAAGR